LISDGKENDTGEREGDKGTKGIKERRKRGREFKIRMKLISHEN